MSEYELAYLLGETEMNMQTIFMNMFSIMSAYLLVAYLLAHRLTKSMSVIINGLFIFAMIFNAFIVQRHTSILFGVIEQVKLMADAGQGLEWHVSRTTPSWLLSISPTIGVVFTLIILVGSLFFFQHAKTANLERSGDLIDRLIGEGED